MTAAANIKYSHLFLRGVSMGKKSNYGKVHPATVTVWAALLAVSSLLPAIPLVGTGGTMSISNVLLPLSGILFGPWAGALAAAIGSFIGQLLAPATAVFGIWTFLIGTITALHAGLLAQGKKIGGIGLAVLVTILWFLHPLGRAVPEEIIFLGLGVISAILGCTIGTKLLNKKTVTSMGIAVLIIAFSSIVVSASYGNVLALLMYQLPREAWIAVLVIAPVERFIFALASMVVGVPLLKGLPKVGVAVGPQDEEEDDSDEPDK